MPKHRTDWFRDARWGVFFHYLAVPTGSELTTIVSSEAWNRRVDRFQTGVVAAQLERVGARYLIFTIGQTSGHYASPNATYDDIVGLKPSKCAQRDLVMDLYDALRPRGIRLMVYLPSFAPRHDSTALERLGASGGVVNGERVGGRFAEFQRNWEAIIREWSLRWGDKISGWWIDGAYFPDEMYRHPEPPNFESFADAMRSGNPDSIVAFNPGVRVPVISLTEHEDYTAGELNTTFPTDVTSRWVGQAQYHTLSYLGQTWGEGAPRFPTEFITGYTQIVNRCDGVVSWDVPIEYNGRIPAIFVDQLKALPSLT